MFPSERANEKENKQGSNKQTNSNKSKLESNMLAVQHVRCIVTDIPRTNKLILPSRYYFSTESEGHLWSTNIFLFVVVIRLANAAKKTKHNGIEVSCLSSK